MPQKERPLTPKQRAFVTWYTSAEVAGNGTEAARRAGYKGTDMTLSSVAKDNIRKPLIAAAIEQAAKDALAAAGVTVEATLKRLQVAHDLAIEAGQFGAAVRALELHGKYLKMFTDRIEHITPITEVPTEELKRILQDIVRSSGIDLVSIIAGDDPGDGRGDHLPGTRTTH